MRSAVFTDRDARMRGADFDVEVRIADGIAHLLVRTTGGEHGKGARKGDVPVVAMPAASPIKLLSAMPAS